MIMYQDYWHDYISTASDAMDKTAKSEQEVLHDCSNIQDSGELWKNISWKQTVVFWELLGVIHHRQNPLEYSSLLGCNIM
jgi:lysozyme family protein